MIVMSELSIQFSSVFIMHLSLTLKLYSENLYFTIGLNLLSYCFSKNSLSKSDFENELTFRIATSDGLSDNIFCVKFSFTA